MSNFPLLLYPARRRQPGCGQSVQGMVCVGRVRYQGVRGVGDSGGSRG